MVFEGLSVWGERRALIWRSCWIMTRRGLGPGELWICLPRPSSGRSLISILRADGRHNHPVESLKMHAHCHCLHQSRALVCWVSSSLLLHSKIPPLSTNALSSNPASFKASSTPTTSSDRPGLLPPFWQFKNLQADDKFLVRPKYKHAVWQYLPHFFVEVQVRVLHHIVILRYERLLTLMPAQECFILFICDNKVPGVTKGPPVSLPVFSLSNSKTWNTC